MTIFEGKLSRWAVGVAIAGGILAGVATGAGAPAGAGETRWWKGNLHTHTLWSDGDDYPEAVTDWYKTNGYHFLTLTDHNILQAGEKWSLVDKSKGGREALERYERRFGGDWVVTRGTETGLEVRLRTLEEFRPIFDEPGRFLLMAGEEITDRHKVLPLHLNAYNIAEFIPARGGTSVVDVLQRNVDAVWEQ